MSPSSLRSHWGWGLAERFPDREARRTLGELLGASLGLEAQEPDEPVSMELAEVPQARLEVPRSLAAFATTDREARLRHTWGRSYPEILRGYRGDFSAAPDLVAHPRTEAEVQATLAWAEEHGVIVTPWGGGTSVVQGLAPAEGSPPRLVLSLRAMNKVIDVDPISRLARIQAGALGPELEDQLRTHGLTLRHFPQSFAFSTLGGWLATRAGGHFATVYTHIDDLCAGMRVVGPTGTFESRTLPASGAGPDPNRLMLGSEGIFGVITEGTLRVRPRPRFKASASVRFTDLDAAVDAVREIAQAGLFPSNCRLLDKREAFLNQVDLAGHHVLVLGFEGAHDFCEDPLADHQPHPLAGPMRQALSIARGRGGTCEAGPRFSARGRPEEDAPADAAATWRQAFLDGPYLQSTLVSLGVVADTFETAVPWAELDALRGEVTTAVREVFRRHGQRGFLSMRFTHVYPDGPAPYFTWLCPAPRGGELALWTEVKAAASAAILATGGTITHHHAVGRVHREAWATERPHGFDAVLRAVKGELDPKGILNPGVLLER